MTKLPSYRTTAKGRHSSLTAPISIPNIERVLCESHQQESENSWVDVGRRYLGAGDCLVKEEAQSGREVLEEDTGCIGG